MTNHAIKPQVLDYMIKNHPRVFFVFGSNLSGYHGAGAARTAHEKYGAVIGVGEGITGKTYALPTVGERMSHMQTPTIRGHVNKFIQFAHENPDLDLIVTCVGCGLAGRKDSDIAPMFWDAPKNCYFDTKWENWLDPVGTQFWGTF